MRFDGKVACVTGATSGIGRACVTALRSEGARVFGIARREDRLREGCEAWSVCDVTEADQVEASIASCVQRFGGIDLLVNAAGIFEPGSLLDTDDASWERQQRVNVDGVRFAIRSAAPALIDRLGSVVNVSSVCGLRPYAGVMAYCVSKAAVDMITRCAALELAENGVRVNAVNPGVVVTELHTVNAAIPDYDAFLKRAESTHPLGRPGQPEEIAALCLWLGSDEAGWVTGATWSIDGGRAILSAR